RIRRAAAQTHPGNGRSASWGDIRSVRFYPASHSDHTWDIEYDHTAYCWTGFSSLDLDRSLREVAVREGAAAGPASKRPCRNPHKLVLNWRGYQRRKHRYRVSHRQPGKRRRRPGCAESESHVRM